MRLHIENFRNIASAQITLESTNFLYGGNGAGKTSVLESLFLLNTLHSFRAVKNLDELIHGDQLCCFLQLDHLYIPGIHEKNSFEKLALEKIRSQTIKLKVGNHLVRHNEYLMAARPIKILSPHVDFLFNIEAEYRRRFGDWLVFHMKPSFHESWSKYEIVLDQRNGALKNRQMTDDDFWIDQLALWGNRVTALRESVFLAWQQRVQDVLKGTSLENKIEINFIKGWVGEDLQQTLNKNRLRDLERGYTEAGAHRCDIQLLSHGLRAANVLSRGQLKLLNLAMAFAQMSLLNTQNTFLLIDDLSAELDGESLSFFKQWINDYQGCLLISLINKEDAQKCAGKEGKFFHIQAGSVEGESQ